MKSTVILSLLPALALAAPNPSPAATKPDCTSSSSHHSSTPSSQPVFTLMALRSASPIHFQPIVAYGESLHIGGETATYCPTVVGSECSRLTSNTTAFYPGGGAMYVEVPGGQQVYVRNDTGAFGYTQAHSAAIPPGAYVGGGKETPASNGQPFGYFSTSAGGATGLFACPAKGSGEKGTGPWQVVANAKGVNVDRCLGFEAAALPYTGPPAWQYT